MQAIVGQFPQDTVLGGVLADLPVVNGLTGGAQRTIAIPQQPELTSKWALYGWSLSFEGQLVQAGRAPYGRLGALWAGVLTDFSVAGQAQPSTGGAAGAARNPAAGVDNAAVGTLTWSNPGSLGAGAGTAQVSSAVNGTTHYLQESSYGFAVPAAATIQGIQLAILRYGEGPTPTVVDSEVKLTKAGVLQATNKASPALWPLHAAGAATATYGGPTDLWGSAWTPADINNAGFGAVLSAIQSNTSQANVIAMALTVFYTGGSAPSPFTTLPPNLAGVAKVWDGASDSPFPPSGSPVQGLVTNAGSSQFPQPVQLEAGISIGFGLWLTPALVNAVGTLIAQANFSVFYEIAPLGP